MPTSNACKGPQLVKDQGYAWVIMVLAFLTHSTHLGFSFSVLGNLTIAHMMYFDISLQRSSLIGSVHNGLMFLFGPVASVLVKKLGCRITQVIGGVCLTLGVGLCYFATEYWQIFLLFSVIAAFGVANCYITTSEILNLYFEKYNYIAFSFAALGQFCGTIAWPTISQKLLNSYGYAKAMAIMAPLHLIHIIAGLLFLEPQQLDPTNQNTDFDGRLDAIKGGELVSEYVKRITTDDAIRGNQTLTDQEKLPADKETLTEEKDAINIVDMNTQMSKGVGNETIVKNQITMTDQSGQGHCTADQSRHGHSTVDQSRHGHSAADSKVSSLKDDFIILLKTPKVWALFTNSVMWNVNTSSFFILINSYIIHQTGSTTDEVAVGITIIGVSNVVGCLLVILLNSLTFNRLVIHLCSNMLFGIITIIIAFCSSKTMFYILAAVWGLGVGVTVSNLLAVTLDFCEPKQLVVLFGLTLLAEGAGALAGAPLCSYVAQKTQAKYGIILSGSAAVLGCFCILPVIISQVSEKHNIQKVSEKAIGKAE